MILFGLIDDAHPAFSDEPQNTVTGNLPGMSGSNEFPDRGIQTHFEHAPRA
jgi:hypothetical protein